MTDYIRAYDNPTNVFHKEARALADKLSTDTILTLRGTDTGVLRWKSNGRVVPHDCAILAYAIGIGVSVSACYRVRDRELAGFLSKYRRSSAGKEPSDEMRVEARAAHGPGAKIVNIITGREFVT